MSRFLNFFSPISSVAMKNSSPPDDAKSTSSALTTASGITQTAGKRKYPGEGTTLRAPMSVVSNKKNVGNDEFNVLNYFEKLENESRWKCFFCDRLFWWVRPGPSISQYIALKYYGKLCSLNLY